MSADKPMPNILDEVIESLARTLLPAIREYFDSEEGIREFAEWKDQKENKRRINPKNLKDIRIE